MIAADRVAVVLLAAGLSRRFGPGDKLLAEIDGKPVAVHAADMLAGIGFGSLIAVCGSEPVADLLGERGFAIVRNDRPDKGQSRSIRLGVEAASENDAILICLADMPFVSAGHYRRLLTAHEPGRVAASMAHGIAQPPALFDRTQYDLLLALSGDQGAKALLVGAKLIEASNNELADIDEPGAIPPPPAPSA